MNGTSSAARARAVQLLHLLRGGDDEEVPTALRLDEYEYETEYGWVLLAATPEAAAADAGAGAAAVRSTTGRDGGGRGVGVRFYRAGARGRHLS